MEKLEDKIIVLATAVVVVFTALVVFLSARPVDMTGVQLGALAGEGLKSVNVELLSSAIEEFKVSPEVFVRRLQLSDKFSIFCYKIE